MKKLKLTHAAKIRGSSNKALRCNRPSYWQEYGVSVEVFKASVLKQKAEGTYNERP